MTWHKIVKPKHLCTVPAKHEINNWNAETGSIWRCDGCRQLWQLSRTSFKDRWTAVEEES